MSSVETHSQKTCFGCTHWRRQDVSTILWEVHPPSEYECDIWQIERQWTEPQAVIGAAVLGPNKKAEAIAQQCPSFDPTSIPSAERGI